MMQDRKPDSFQQIL